MNFKNRLISVAIAVLAPLSVNAATLVSFGNPWGEIGTVQSAMDSAFGAGGWDDLSSPVGTGFLAGESFVYFEGGDSTTDLMESYFNTNSVALLNWLSAGGSMFINAAPNIGDGLSFAGLSINYPSGFCGSGCAAVDAAHSIFSGINTVFSGNSFAHGTVSGGTRLITNGSTGSVLSESVFGNGHIMMGTMTTPNWHYGTSTGLLANVVGYAANAATPAPVPLPATLPLLGAAIAGLTALRRRKKTA